MASERADAGSVAEALETGRRVIRAERAGLDALADSLDPAFAEAVALIGGASGRLIVCGVGKSGHVARKVSATFASTGTPSFFLHAAEAGHGDLGIIGSGDVVLILSNSGQSRELLPVLQFIQRRGLPLIAVTSDAGSDLARAAQCLLRLPPVAEADPAIPAPTTSALMMLALGDALAAALWHRRGFSADDFSRLHPSGRLGAALARVGDLLDGLPPAPQVALEASLREIAEAITRGGLGCALVTDPDTDPKAGANTVTGLITDGDLRARAAARSAARGRGRRVGAGHHDPRPADPRRRAERRRGAGADGAAADFPAGDHRSRRAGVRIHARAWADHPAPAAPAARAGRLRRTSPHLTSPSPHQPPRSFGAKKMRGTGMVPRTSNAVVCPGHPVRPAVRSRAGRGTDKS